MKNKLDIVKKTLKNFLVEESLLDWTLKNFYYLHLSRTISLEFKLVFRTGIVYTNIYQ